MKPKTHGCPYLQNRHRCTHKSKHKICIYSNAEKCPYYNEWVELKETIDFKEKTQQEASYGS